jgi:hypothetical protein
VPEGVRAYGREVLIAWDVAFNVTLFMGKQGQTISGRLADARAAGRPIGCYGCRILDWLFRDGDHCELARLGDIRRAQIVIEDLSDIAPRPLNVDKLDQWT